MARSLFGEVKRDMERQGWMLDGPFLALYIGDGHFVVQMRPRGERMDETYSTVVESFSETVIYGRC